MNVSYKIIREKYKNEWRLLSSRNNNMNLFYIAFFVDNLI